MMSLIAILPPTSFDPRTQWFAKYSSASTGSFLCPDKITGSPLFEISVKKHTSSNSMVRSCVPIWNPYSVAFHKPIIYSRRRTSFFIFCILKNLRRLQFLKAALDQGLCNVATSLISGSLSFHSVMTFVEFTYNQQQEKVISHAILTIFGQ